MIYLVYKEKLSIILIIVKILAGYCVDDTRTICKCFSLNQLNFSWFVFCLLAMIIIYNKDYSF